MSKKLLCEPVWSEGMFLTPQHYQYVDRHKQAAHWFHSSHLAIHPWGFKHLEIDTDALANFNFNIIDCQALLQEGTIVVWPGNLELTKVSFKELMPTDGTLMVYLGVPQHQPHNANLYDSANSGSGVSHARYVALEVEQMDENTGSHPRNIQIKRLRGRLFFGDQDRTGYESLPMARLVPGPAGAGARLDSTYIPPVLITGAWAPLQALVQELSSKIQATLNALKTSIGSEEIGEMLSTPRGLETSLKFLALGGSEQVIGQMTQTSSMHPYTLYMELVRLYGQLTAFHGDLQLADPPRYQQDELGTCFRRIYKNLATLLEHLATPSYVRRNFVLRKDRMQVELRADWASGARQIYIAVRGTDSPETKMQQVAGLKLCAPSDLDEVKHRRLEGIPVEWLKKAPSLLPSRENLLYGSITAGGDFWSTVQEDLALDLLGYESLPYKFDLFIV